MRFTRPKIQINGQDSIEEANTDVGQTQQSGAPDIMTIGNTKAINFENFQKAASHFSRELKKVTLVKLLQRKG